MPQPRRILPSDTLENGFRVAHNETVDAMPDYAQCLVTDGGLLQFYNDLGEYLGEIDLSTVFRKLSDSSGEGGATQFNSASETEEGVAKIATADDVEAGENQFKFITPALLKYAFGLLKLELQEAVVPIPPLSDTASDGPQAVDTPDPASPNTKKSVRISWRKAAQYIANGMEEGLDVLASKLLFFISWDRLMGINNQTGQNIIQRDGNLIQLVKPGDKGQRGWLWGNLDEGGNLTGYTESVQRNPDGSIDLTTGNVIMVRITRAVIGFYRDVVGTGKATFSSFRHTAPPAISNPTHFMVSRQDSTGFDEGVMSVPAFAQLLINSPEFIAAYGQPTPVEEIRREILCYDEYDIVSGPLTVKPGQIGQPLSHTLHLTADKIFGQVWYADGQPATGYSLTYPDADHFVLNDVGAGGGETADLIVELKKRTR